MSTGIQKAKAATSGIRLTFLPKDGKVEASLEQIQHANHCADCQATELWTGMVSHELVGQLSQTLQSMTPPPAPAGVAV